MTYRDSEKTLTFGKSRGKFKYQESFMLKLITDGKCLNTVNVSFAGEDTVINLV